MNERILSPKLLKLVQDAGPGYSLANPEWVKKFAELIICECIGVVDSMADPDDSERYFWAIQNASQKIKQHFGVEA